MSSTMRLSSSSVMSFMFLVTVMLLAFSGTLSQVSCLDSMVASSSSSKLVSSSSSSQVKSTITSASSSWEPQVRAARQTTVVTASTLPLGPVFVGRGNNSSSSSTSSIVFPRTARILEAQQHQQQQQSTTVPSVISVRSIVTSNSPVYTASSSNVAPQRISSPVHNSSSSGSFSQPRNKPLLNALVNKLETLSSKLDELNAAQSNIQKAFDTLESRFSLSATMDDVPQCGRRVDRVLRTLTPLVSRVEGLWSVVSGYSSNPNLNSFSGVAGSAKQATNNVNVPPSQFLAPGDALLSESRRQERAISAIRSDLNAKSQQILTELGTVEQQLDVLQTNLKKPPPGSGPQVIDQSDLQAPVDVQTNTDVTFQVVDAAFTTPGGNGSKNINPSSGVPAVVFPSVKNKPIADATALDGADALLTGSGQTRSSCAELMMQPGQKRSGLYHIRLPGARSSFWQLLVYCDQESSGGGWMVVQRRADFGEPRESFHRNWVEYRSGFGDPVRELWIGNINLHLLTNSEDQVLRIELEDFDGEKRYAEYSTFRVASEADAFRLEVGGYSGDAGDALSDPWYGAHGSAFSTHDRDNDRSSLNCASMLKGGWWWKSCGRGLNGLYFDSQQPDSALARQGIVWFRWKGWDYTLKKATIMIRPKSFRPGNFTAAFTTPL